ncbi:hypothetical protein IT072_15700 [Leifsonia sp. ZF2019]|uniref:hypothetical protein n=1 Tax=Leifsonia sp. ZF2019 TaxID=2781978 RepID=UPI001CBE3344|nr:hypothetical protein [Leifsonia sp. ZF2019]UAJ78666.1 hypothetical protein IT072_15700 [Leifsonia sp. ZF2019]
MPAVTRTADPIGAPAAPAAVTAGDLREPPLVVIDVERAAGRYLELRAAFPWVDVHYDVSALSHPALLDAIAAASGAFEVATPASVNAVIARDGRPRFLHTGLLAHRSEVDAAYAAGVRRFVVDAQNDLDAFAGAPDDVRVLLRLRPLADPRSAHRASRGFAPDHIVRAVRAASDRDVCVGGLSLQPPAHSSPSGYVAEIAHAAAVAADVRAAVGLRFETLDLGDGFPGRAATRPAEQSELARAVRAIVAPATSHVSIIASASRAVTAGCLSVVDGASAREADPAYASECIDAGADVRVLTGALRSGLRERLSFFRADTERGHRVLRPRRARATWSPAG